jgi:hypothetical protein
MPRAVFLLAMITITLTVGRAAEPERRLFEIRTVIPHPGKSKALLERFKNHVVPMFERNGAETVGYLVPVDPKVEKVVYILAFKNHDSRTETMQKVDKDSVWTKAFTDSEKNGPLAKEVYTTLLTATDYSPAIKPLREINKKTFELRTYTASKDNILPLNDRFRNHTVKLFEKHGMTNVGYWIVANLPQPNNSNLHQESTLIYLLAHDSPEAAQKSFTAFRADPVWVKAKAESEKQAGGPLTVEKNGVVSEFFKLADFNPKK